MSNLRTAVEELATTADQCWQEYLRVGPVAMRRESIEPFNEQLRLTAELVAECVDELPIADWRSRYEKAIADLEPLLKKCVERTEGLSFVTGEAGLIPRKDQHALCESAIASLGELVSD